MSEKPENPSAFPKTIVIPGHSGSSHTTHIGGMSLRDYFAAAALQGMMSGVNGPNGTPWVHDSEEIVAHWAYSYANAMLIARSKS